MGSIDVTIRYRLATETEWHDLTITPEEYFLLDDREIATFESVPVHDHAVEYLSLISEPIAETRIVVSESAQRRTVISEVFWADGKGRLIERCDFHGEFSYREVIVDAPTCDSSTTVLRMVDSSGTLQLLYHARFDPHSDGTVRETKYFPK